ncbi:hypothetical protein OG218_20375 [Kineococcus sp. NBC_00420]|uniref:hypothetical protein n=1 Tax=Kineococcus sp. NBC_00420 TaxID=2903564 RepID=UPI002E1F7A80
MVHPDGLPRRRVEPYPLKSAFIGLTGSSLCLRHPLERALGGRGVDFADQLDWWRSIVALGHREDFVTVMQDVAGVLFVDPPEGNSWVRWANWVDERLTELVDDPTTVADVPRYAENWQIRYGELDAAARDGLRRAMAKLSVPGGVSRRDYLVLDVGRPVGTVSAGEHDSNRRFDETVTTRVGVVLERSGRTRVIGVHAADPEDEFRGAEWRARWPVLTSLLGGWFSLAAVGDQDPSAMQYRMLREESGEHLERLAVEGAELLALGDDDLHAAVRALGCYVEPSWLRLWLEWMFWRIGYFDWT